MSGFGEGPGAASAAAAAPDEQLPADSSWDSAASHNGTRHDNVSTTGHQTDGIRG